MGLNKYKSVAFTSPRGKSKDGISGKYDLYKKEKELLRKQFAGMDNIDWTSPEMAKKLKGIARKIIETTADQVNQKDLVSETMPTEQIQPGDTFVLHELSGANVWYGTYGASVRMSRPQFTPYSVKPELKEIGLKLDLIQLQTGKYSVSELGDYTANLITAWRNRLLFVITLAGITEFQSGGAQYTSGVSLSIGTLLLGIDKLTDEGEMRMWVGRRNAIHQLANQSAFSNETLREFETQGMIGKYAGAPVFKTTSFTDLDYGTVYPFPKDDLWLFSDLPAGRMVQAGALRTADEVVPQNETMNIFYRWDDGIGIFHTDRIVRFAGIT